MLLLISLVFALGEQIMNIIPTNYYLCFSRIALFPHLLASMYVCLPQTRIIML